MKKNTNPRYFNLSFITNFLDFLPLLILFLILLIFSVIIPNFLKLQNFLNISRQIAINGIIAIGMTLTILSGGLDLSVGSILVLSICVGSFAMKAGLPVPIIILIIFITGIFLGFLNGTLINKLSITPFITTLATYTIYRMLAIIITGGYSYYLIPQSILFLGGGFYPILILVIVWVIAIFVTVLTKFGRNIYSIGGNEQASLFSGIDVEKYKLYIYTISGFLCSLAGILYIARTSAISAMAGIGYEFQAIAAVVIGGTNIIGGEGNIFRTIIGTLIIGFLLAGLSMLGIDPNWHGAISGGTILLAITLNTLKKFYKYIGANKYEKTN